MENDELATSRKAESGPEPETLPRRPMVFVGDVIPVVPNFIATGVTFTFVMAFPWIVSWLEEMVTSTMAPGGAVTATGIFATFLVVGFVAGGCALLCLVVGAILQFWQHHKPFESWWPVVLAFPVLWCLLLPEMWVRGLPVLDWILLGSAIALTFSVHWVALVIAREVLD